MTESPETPEATPQPKFGIGTIVNHQGLGRGRVVGYEGDCYAVVFKGQTAKLVPFAFPGLSAEEICGNPEFGQIKQAVREVLEDYGWIEGDLEMGKRWLGGNMVLNPGNEETQPKEIPIEAFLKKVIGVRDKLRVLEQKLNSHPLLSPEDKLEFQGYITRCYGSLTTFNSLFATKESQFRGQSGKE